MGLSLNPLLQRGDFHKALTPSKRLAPQYPGRTPPPLRLHCICLLSASPYLPKEDGPCSYSFVCQPKAWACKVRALRTHEKRNTHNATRAASLQSCTGLLPRIWTTLEGERVASCKSFAFMHLLSDGENSTVDWGRPMGRDHMGYVMCRNWEALLSEITLVASLLEHLCWEGLQFSNAPKKGRLPWETQNLKGFYTMSPKKKPLGGGMQDTGKRWLQTRQLPPPPRVCSSAEIVQGGCLNPKWTDIHTSSGNYR